MKKYKLFCGVDFMGNYNFSGGDYVENMEHETNSKEEAERKYKEFCETCKKNLEKNDGFCYYTYLTESYPKDYRRTIKASRFIKRGDEIVCYSKL